MDEKTISEFGIDGFTLMEIAGTRAADLIMSEIPSASHGIFFCGKGNNGGDALVVARLLSQQGHSITICFLSGTDDLSPDAGKNLQLLEKLNADIDIIDWDEFTPGTFNYIVDGMLGTGLDSDVRAPYSDAIEWINQQEQPVFCLDVPTGLNSDTGQIMGASVQADFTLAFGALKKGFYLNEGFDTTGEVILCELSFPNKYKKPSAYLIDQNWVDQNTAVEKARKHKYDGGVLYIIAGSEGLTGAGILAARSAWSAGLGAVVLITPKGLLGIYEKQLEQIIKKPIGEVDDVYFKPTHLESVKNILNEKPGNLLIGPGLGREPETIHFIQELLLYYDGDATIDADALFALSQHDEIKKPPTANWILTPHPGELKTLTGKDLEEDHKRLELVKKLATDKNITILSKGIPGIVGTETGETYITGYDTRNFTRAGFGDVLAGKVSAHWLIYRSPEIACFKALLDGKIKADNYYSSHSGVLEPIDII